jgi:purine nucleosidase
MLSIRRLGPLVVFTTTAAMTIAACANQAASSARPSSAPPAQATPSNGSSLPPDTRSADHPKIIFDTDFGELNDDSQALFILLQAEVNVLGVTTVTGNTWSVEGAAYALRQLELQNKQYIPVMQGSADPLFGNRAAQLPTETQLFGVDASYSGAWGQPQPLSYRQLAQPPYGGYANTPKSDTNAVDFIVNTIKQNPHQVTVFELGPTTNLALAVKKNPEIVPLVKQVIYMGGAFNVPGNQGPAAEFNIWFDPEAARIAFTTPFPDQLVIPLDATDQVWYSKNEYDRVVGGANTPIKQEFKDLQGPLFAKDPDYRVHLWDVLTAGVFLRPSLITGSSMRKVTVDTQQGPDHGRTLSFDPVHAPTGTQSVRIVQAIDVPKFYELFVAELSKPLAP